MTISGLAELELLPPFGYEAAYMPDRPVVGFAFDSQSGTHAFASSKRSPFRANPNHVSFVPKGCDVYSQSSRGGEYLKIELQRTDGALATSERRFSNVIDPVAIDAAGRLRRLLLGLVTDSLLAEHQVQRLVERAGRILHGGGELCHEAQWMTPRRLRRVEGLIEARLDGKLTVQEIADRLGLSAGFFSRAFKAAVGKAPHDYIIDRRIARARALLREGRQDLSSVALAAGFASHAHMTAVFGARLGATPSAVRRAMTD